MSQYDDDEPQGAQARERNQRRAPYETGRRVRTYGDDDPYAAEHPWQAAHPGQPDEGGRRPRWSEQPARYGGGYRDDELWSTPRGDRGDARYGLDTHAERHFAEGYQNEDNRHRAHGYGPTYRAWREPRDEGRARSGQSNSGYDSERAYGQGSHQDDARSDRVRASWTQEHDYEGPRYGATNRSGSPSRGDYGSQHGHTDTYGGAGFRQEGKRYWFDESDQRSRYRGTQPRGYERSDDRLRELVCERLTDADIDASDIEVRVSQGNVTLEGSVRARWMKHQAEDIVDDIGGVKDIHNQLRVTKDGNGPSGNHAQDAQNTQNLAGTTGSPATGSNATGTPGGTTDAGSATMGPSSSGTGQGGRSRH